MGEQPFAQLMTSLELHKHYRSLKQPVKPSS